MWCRAVFPVLSWILLSNLLIHFAIASPNPLQAEPPHCDKNFYGSPVIEDCLEAILWIPKRNPSADSMSTFAEPQLLIPPFKALKNSYAPKAIIQLPKIFKYGESDETSSHQMFVVS